MEFETVIGLEVHAQLMTNTKIFCACSTEFNAPPNSQVCPVCAGHPGSLPVLNEKVLEYALKSALALHCKIEQKSIFARKNYFYPDLPKGYQISQYEQPFAKDGHLTIDVGGTPQKPELATQKHIRIERIHMEEDAGKSMHMTGYTLVNLNRACTPLIEIVSCPDLRTSEEAGAYLRKLRAILMYIEVCDGNMQEGSLRCDANVSIRPKGEEKFGTRAEIKNLNSFRFLEKAVEYEVLRQTQVLQSGGRIVQETRTYDSARNVTLSMRSKEEAHDYRYFPEPDLLPLVVLDEQLTKLQKMLPELPDQKKDRYIKEFNIPAYDASVITSSKKLAEFFEKTVGVCGEPKIVSNWVMGELLRLLKEAEPEDLQPELLRDVKTTGSNANPTKHKNMEDMSLKPQDLGDLIQLIKKGVISNNIAKTVFEEMMRTGADPQTIVKEKNLTQVSDTATIEKVIAQIISSNPSQVAEWKAGKEKLFGFFVGQVMKQMQGKANPATVNELLKKALGSSQE